MKEKFSFKNNDWAQKPNPREKIIFALVLLVLVFNFFKAFWLPTRNTIKTLKTQIEAMEVEKEEMGRFTQVQTGISTSKSSRTLPALEKIDDAVQHLSQPNLLRGLTLVDSKFTKPTTGGGIVQQQAELILRGSFQAVARYIEATESLSTPLFIETFSIGVTDDNFRGVLLTLKG